MILHSKVAGEGVPIIFLHTGLQTGETDFVYQREHFKDSFCIVLPDLRAHGKSQVGQIDIHTYFEDTAGDLAKTMDHLNIEKAHIVGCSLGALVGLLFAKRFPARVHSLTLSGIIPLKPTNWNELIEKDTIMQKALLQNVEAIHYFNSIHTSDWRDFLIQSMGEDWYPFDETGDLSSLECPTLFIVGERQGHEVDGASLYPRQNSKIHVAVVPFAGHLVHSEQPEIFTTILDLFLRGL